jgi:S-adenosylmethionine hydrolase
VAPDNGLISLLLRMIPGGRVFELLREDPELPVLSNTFHGRDLFAPAAALCSAGFAERLRGAAIDPEVQPWAVPKPGKDSLTGEILHVDRFGNCISSLHRTDLSSLPGSENRIGVRTGAFRSERIHRTYADAPIGAPLSLIGSSGFLEIAVREGSAAERFGLDTGCPLIAYALSGPLEGGP